jgi:hypothetical protein
MRWWLGGVRGGTFVLVLVASAFALSACGGSNDEGAAEVARQQELRAARAQAAQDARQSGRIADLERKLQNADKAGSESGTTQARSSSGPDPMGEQELPTPEPLTGLWKGAAVINYDDGGSDPFEQTIQIESLVPDEASGYSEAVQGSTTCHGPITFQGTSGNWYRFSAEEENKSECIDSSEVELLPVSPDVIDYRETTEASLSTGTLQRVR